MYRSFKSAQAQPSLFTLLILFIPISLFCFMVVCARFKNFPKKNCIQNKTRQAKK